MLQRLTEHKIIYTRVGTLYSFRVRQVRDQVQNPIILRSLEDTLGNTASTLQVVVKNFLSPINILARPGTRTNGKL